MTSHESLVIICSLVGPSFLSSSLCCCCSNSNAAVSRNVEAWILQASSSSLYRGYANTHSFCGHVFHLCFFRAFVQVFTAAVNQELLHHTPEDQPEHASLSSALQGMKSMGACSCLVKNFLCSICSPSSCSRQTERKEERPRQKNASLRTVKQAQP